MKPSDWVVTMPIGDPPNYADMPGKLAEGRWPTCHDLDRVSPDNPVYIRGIWTPWNVPPSVSVANSLALRLADVGRDTKSPHSSVTIERDTSGEPTGVFVDENIYPVVEFTLMRVVPRFTHADRAKALKESMRAYNSVGTTTVYEGHGVAPEVLRVYEELRDRREMTVRSHLVLSPNWTSRSAAAEDMTQWEPQASGFGSGGDWLRTCGVFIQLGGQEHVARLRSAELSFTGWAGFAESHNSLEEFRAFARLAAEHNLRVHVLSASEDEIEAVLNVFEELAGEFPIAERRWVLEHVRDVRTQHVPRMKQLGVVCETIPLTHVWLRGSAYLDDVTRAQRLVPHRDFIDSGVPFGMGTDNKPFNPFRTIWASVVRQERTTGAVLGPEQCLSREEALRAFTMGGAYFCGIEDQRGSIEPGKLADLAVLSADPLTVAGDALPEIRALMTLVGGRIVHDTGDLDSSSK